MDETTDTMKTVAKVAACALVVSLVGVLAPIEFLLVVGAVSLGCLVVVGIAVSLEQFRTARQMERAYMRESETEPTTASGNYGSEGDLESLQFVEALPTNDRPEEMSWFGRRSSALKVCGAKISRLSSKDVTDEVLERNLVGERPQHLFPDIIYIGFVGRSGVGKSSLFNAYTRYFLRASRSDEEYRRLSREIPHADVGAVETTQYALQYRIPGTDWALLDNPGHGTVTRRSTEYIRNAGIRYFFQVFYVYAGRLEENDMMLLLNLIIYDIGFVVLRQKFVQDLKTFAMADFERRNPSYDPYLDGEDGRDAYVRDRIQDEVFIAECKARLEEEFRTNWRRNIEQSPADNVRGNDKYMNADLKFFCVDSNRPEHYDTPAVFDNTACQLIKICKARVDDR